MAAGKTVADFGESQQSLTKPARRVLAEHVLRRQEHGGQPGREHRLPLVSTSPISSLSNVSDTAFPKFDTSVPDIYRYQIWLRNFEKNGPANLNISKYWKDSAIFVVEDDSQAGSDHVDGHRAPVQVISPWAQHGVVDNHYYTQITMMRTIEQILRIAPLNQKDSAASPMTAEFTCRGRLRGGGGVGDDGGLAMRLAMNRVSVAALMASTPPVVQGPHG